jgi:SAM-dependent methyltransferase
LMRWPMGWREDAAAWARDRYPRSSAYDLDWMMDNMMGPNALWLMESLCQVVSLEPGMRVLDMGCGKAISSIFLAKEFDVQVWATDLWIGASENWGRVVDAGVQDRVFPIHADAHTLPFAEGFFDAMVSVDAYYYFGTDELYFDTYSRFAREAAAIGIIVPGVVQELASVPEHLRDVWVPEFHAFHSPAWWRDLWTRSGRADVLHADLVPDGWREWLLWVGNEHDDGRALEVDRGRYLGVTRLVARTKGPPGTSVGSAR